MKYINGRKQAQKRYYVKNKERILRRRREYYAKNKDRHIAQMKEYYAKNREHLLAKRRENRAKNKDRFAAAQKKHHALFRDSILSAYGNKCTCCGETQKDFLTIDHVYNNGAQERKKIKQGRPLYRYLRDNNYPPDYQILCRNCNWSKHINHGKCIHAIQKKAKENHK